jgi:hypothetical protein
MQCESAAQHHDRIVAQREAGPELEIPAVVHRHDRVQPIVAAPQFDQDEQPPGRFRGRPCKASDRDGRQPGAALEHETAASGGERTFGVGLHLS